MHIDIFLVQVIDLFLLLDDEITKFKCLCLTFFELLD